MKRCEDCRYFCSGIYRIANNHKLRKELGLTLSPDILACWGKYCQDVESCLKTKEFYERKWWKFWRSK